MDTKVRSVMTVEFDFCAFALGWGLVCVQVHLCPVPARVHMLVWRPKSQPLGVILGNVNPLLRDRVSHWTGAASEARLALIQACLPSCLHFSSSGTPCELWGSDSILHACITNTVLTNPSSHSKFLTLGLVYPGLVLTH